MTKLAAIQKALVENKRQMVLHWGDEETLKRFSGEKEQLKKQLRRYCSCGSPKSYRSLLCWMCWMRKRHQSNAIAASCCLLLFICGCSTDPQPISSIMPPTLSTNAHVVSQSLPAPTMHPFHVSWKCAGTGYVYQVYSSNVLTWPLPLLATVDTNGCSGSNNWQEQFVAVAQYWQGKFMEWVK